MATSGTYGFTLTRDDIIIGALRLLGAYNDAEVVPPNDIITGAQALNILAKEFAIEGLPLWCVQEFPVLLLPGQSTYDLSALSGTTLPLRILDVVIRTFSSATQYNDVALILLSHFDWIDLGSKSQPGIPNQGYYDPQLGAGTLYVTPIPVVGGVNFTGTISTTVLTVATVTVGTIATGQVLTGAGITAGTTVGVLLSGTGGAGSTWAVSVSQAVAVAVAIVGQLPTNTILRVIIQRQIQDFNLAVENPDFPQEAYRLLKWCLADEIALEYQTPESTRREINQKAAGYKEKFIDSQQEQVSVMFTPSERAK